MYTIPRARQPLLQNERPQNRERANAEADLFGIFRRHLALPILELPALTVEQEVLNVPPNTPERRSDIHMDEAENGLDLGVEIRLSQ